MSTDWEGFIRELVDAYGGNHAVEPKAKALRKYMRYGNDSGGSHDSSGILEPR